MEVKIDARDLSLDPVIKKISRVRYAFFELLLSVAANERIRVFARRQLHDPDDKIVFQQCIERALGRFGAGGVRIEAKNHFSDKALQDARLIFCERRPLWRDDIRDPCLEQADQIELAFAHNRTVRFDQCALGFVQSKEDVALSERAASPVSSGISPRLPLLSATDR